MFYHVYQASVSPLKREDRDAVETYRDLQFLFESDLAEVVRKVRAGVEQDLFRLTWVVDCFDLEHVFKVTNMGLEDYVTYRDDAIATSGSVGNVMIDSKGNAWVCMPAGWLELPDDLAIDLRVQAAPGTQLVTMYEDEGSKAVSGV